MDLLGFPTSGLEEEVSLAKTAGLMAAAKRAKKVEGRIVSR